MKGKRIRTKRDESNNPLLEASVWMKYHKDVEKQRG